MDSLKEYTFKQFSNTIPANLTSNWSRLLIYYSLRYNDKQHIEVFSKQYKSMDLLKEYTFLQLSYMIPATLIVIDLGYLDIIHLDRMINSTFKLSRNNTNQWIR